VGSVGSVGAESARSGCGLDHVVRGQHGARAGINRAQGIGHGRAGTGRGKAVACAHDFGSIDGRLAGLRDGPIRPSP
jgi:hypothetical protein